MSTRQVAGLLAAAAPEVVPSRDTLRAVAPDRYTLKVSIDQECEQGLRRLKGLLSHLDPRMSWGDLVARLVRDAVARHEPRGGGSGQRRRSADSAGASSRRAPKKTRAAGAAAGPAQRASESSGRSPNGTCAAAAPAAPAQRGGGATPAPPGDTAATERQKPIAMLANAAPPRQSAPAAQADGALAGGAPSAAPAVLSDGARAGGAPSSAPAAAAAPRFAGGASADDVDAGASVSVSPVVTSAPELAFGVSSDGGPRGASAGAVAGALADGSHAGAACRSRRSPLRRRSRHSACSLTADRAAPQPGQRRTPPAILSAAATSPRHGATFLSRSGASSGNATQDAAVIAIRSPGVAATLPICCRSTTCCRSPKGTARIRQTCALRALLTTECATATAAGRLRLRSPRCSACSVLVARRDTLRSAARRACIFAAASSGPGRGTGYDHQPCLRAHPRGFSACPGSGWGCASTRSRLPGRRGVPPRVRARSTSVAARERTARRASRESACGAGRATKAGSIAPGTTV